MLNRVEYSPLLHVTVDRSNDQIRYKYYNVLKKITRVLVEDAENSGCRWGLGHKFYITGGEFTLAKSFIHNNRVALPKDEQLQYLVIVLHNLLAMLPLAGSLGACADNVFGGRRA